MERLIYSPLQVNLADLIVFKKDSSGNCEDLLDILKLYIRMTDDKYIWQV